MADATTQMKETAQEAAGQAREQVEQAAGQARGRMRDEVDSRSTQAGQQVSGTAGDLRSVAESLREQGKDQPAKLAEKAADRAERLGGYLEQSDADRILSDVEDFARRQPWVVGLGAAALGFAAARFVKASSTQRYESQSQSQFNGGGATPYARPQPTGSLTAPGAGYGSTPPAPTSPGNGGPVSGSALGGSPSPGI